MPILHGIWWKGLLHVFGERAEGDGANGQTSSADRPCILHADLRRVCGDAWDSLLIAGAADAELLIRLPFRTEELVGSTSANREPASLADETATLRSVRVTTLAFLPTDAIDLLVSRRQSPASTARIGDSLRFWSRAAELVMGLLAGQSFVPALHDFGVWQRGYWRVVIDDESVSRQVAALIASMPPVCRAAGDEAVQASDVVESFLWMTVDALARRCLEGDELAHALLERPTEDCTAEMLWLRSLVGSDAALQGPLHLRMLVRDNVRAWLSRLVPPPLERVVRTCIRLHPPPPEELPDGSSDAKAWRLTLHLQSKKDPSLIVDGGDLAEQAADAPMILPRPFHNGLGQLRADVAVAARNFPPLAACAEADGPLECRINLAEAYTFLRDAVPLLEVEGFGVWLPAWWRPDASRLRLQMGLRPAPGNAETGVDAIRLDTLVEYNWRIAVGDESLTLDELARLAEEKAPLVRIHGRWTEAQPAELQAALAFLSRNSSGTIPLFEALRRCYLADDLDTGLPVIGLQAEGWVKLLLGGSEFQARIDDVPPPKGFFGTLRPYQMVGLNWLTFLSRLGLGACLADDMGLGKTIQVIALWLGEREKSPPPGPTLLIVPMSLVGNWQREIAKFAPSLRVMIHHGLERLSGREFVERVGENDVIISTYALAHRDFEHLAAVAWHRLVLDEAQNIKNPAAKQSVAIRALRASHRVGLTGTPVENRLSELWSIMDFLNPAYLGSGGDFRRRFAVPIERHRDEDRASRLRHLIRPFVLRRLKTDPTVQVDLPPKMEMKVYCNLTREQAALYEAVVGEMLGQIDHSEGMQRRGLVLAALTKLKQICNHPAHFLGDGSELGMRSGKCERLTEMMEEVLAEGDRSLIFTQYREMGNLLQRHLSTTFGREVLFLHGATSRRQREALIDRFQAEGDAPIFLLSLKAGGFGLNLTAASHVFHYDRWWNPAVEDQATDRAHRIGQDKRVQVHKFMCIGTLEERIDAMLDRKRNLAENVIGSGEAWITEMSTEALRDLFTLSREAVAEG